MPTQPMPAPELFAGLPSEAQEILERMSQSLEAMVVTPAGAAEEGLEARNQSRREIWGDQAATVALRRGSPNDVLVALVECVAADYATGAVARITREDEPAPPAEVAARAEGLREQLGDMSPALRARYEKKFMKRMRKAQEPGTTTGRGERTIRKIAVTVHFQETFGRHEILRTADREYFLMPCSER